MVLLLAALATTLQAQTVIRLVEEPDGRLTMPATVNGVGVRTYYTQESWFASMSSTTYLFLYENGYIVPEDVRGMTVVSMPDGSTTKAASLVIRSLRIGNVIVKDLPAFVIKSQSVPLLVGCSAFDAFGEVSLSGNELTIEDGIVHPAPEPASLPDPLDSLKAAAQEHLAAKDYSGAATCLETIRSAEGLCPADEYQYITVLNILGRGGEVISLGTAWLSENSGKSVLLDYWIYDALGDSYAGLGRTVEAIDAYQKAVERYCSMFSTTEKGIARSQFQDTTLGVTLFDLARQHAAAGNLRKSEHYYALSAKCGNRTAQEVCEKYNIRLK